MYIEYNTILYFWVRKTRFEIEMSYFRKFGKNKLLVLVKILKNEQ